MTRQAGQRIWLGICLLWLVTTLYVAVADAARCYRAIPYFLDDFVLTLSGVALAASCFASGTLSWVVGGVVFTGQWVAIFALGRRMIALWPTSSRTKRWLGPGLLLLFLLATTWFNHALLISLNND